MDSDVKVTDISKNIQLLAVAFRSTVHCRRLINHVLFRFCYAYIRRIVVHYLVPFGIFMCRYCHMLCLCYAS